MSLRVWLPLNGTLNNQGLYNLPNPSLNRMVLDNNGKIGKCYSKYLIYHLEQDNLIDNEWSICMWVKFNSMGPYNNILFCKNDNESTTCQIYFSIVSTTSLNLGINGGSSGNAGAYPYDFELNKWYHLAATYDGINWAMYINGEKFKSGIKQTTKINNMNNIGIGIRSDNNAGTSGTGQGEDRYYNDFRIYDHALSPFEVKQISQGLVLHYPLNRNGWGQENLATCNTVQYNLAASTANWNHFWITSSTALEPNTTYTFSAEVEVSDNYERCTVYNYTASGKSGEINYYFPADGKRHSWTFTTTSNALGVIAYAGTAGSTANYSAIYKKIKLEKGSMATPWCPNSSDALATSMGLNDNVEYDTSGYGNNGEYYSYDTLGSIEYDSDSPKYNVCTFINSDNNTTNTASGTRYLYGHCGLTHPTEMTVSFWCKPLGGYYGGANQGQFCTTNIEYGNINAGYDYQDSAMNHRDGWVDMNDSSSASQCHPEITFIPNEWHYYAFTYDGQNGKSYRDGLLQNTKSFSEPKTLDSFIGVILGFSKAGGVWRSNKSYYSDFRVYCTALSIEDIKSLYNNSAYIDNQGNIYGAVYEEV